MIVRFAACANFADPKSDGGRLSVALLKRCEKIGGRIHPHRGGREIIGVSGNDAVDEIRYCGGDLKIVLEILAGHTSGRKNTLAVQGSNFEGFKTDIDGSIGGTCILLLLANVINGRD